MIVPHFAKSCNDARFSRKTNDPNGSPLRLRIQSCDQFRLRRTCPSGPKQTVTKILTCAYRSFSSSQATYKVVRTAAVFSRRHQPTPYISNRQRRPVVGLRELDQT